MEPLLLRIPGKEPTSNIGRVFDIKSVVSIENTILDEKSQKEGVSIDLPCDVEIASGIVSSLNMPACAIHEDDGMIVLDDIAIRINNLLRVIKLVESGEKKPAALAKSVANLQHAVRLRLVGKRGTLSRDVIGRRSSNTCRAVLLPSYNEDPSIAYMPNRLMKKIEAKTGDCIVVGRDPTIWHGSMEILTVRPTDGSCIRLHPFIFSQFGADCDGDCVWAMAIPDHLQAQMKDEVLSFAKQTTARVSRVASGQSPQVVDWESPSQSSEALFESTGFSISPRDLVYGGSDMKRFKESSGKNIADEALRIADKKDNKMILDYLVVVNLTMLIQKVYLGPVGAAAQKIKLISGEDPRLTESANYFSEKIQQRLFDTKGSVQGDQEELIIFFELLDLVNMNGKYSSKTKTVTHEDVIDRLVELGMSKEKVTPIITFLYCICPLTRAMESIYKGIDPHERERVCRNVPYKILSGTDLQSVIDELSQITGESVPMIISRCRLVKSRITLGTILGDPLYDLMNPFSEEKTNDAIKDLKNKIEKPQNKKFTRLTETIFTLSRKSRNDISENIEQQIEATGVSMLCRDGRRGRQGSNLQSVNDRNFDEEAACQNRLHSSAAESG